MDSKRVAAFRPAARVGVIASSIALLAMLVFPNAAFAATIIGAPVGDPLTVYCSFASLDAIQVSTDSSSSYVVPPGGGVITSWNSQTAGLTGLVGLQVWRLVTPADPVTGLGPVYQLVGASPLVTPTGAAITLTTPIPVAAGDLLGMQMQGLVACGNRTASTQDFWAQSFGPTPAAGGTEAFNLANSMGRLNISATVDAATPPPPPPPPAQNGCDSTGQSTGNDQCTQGNADKSQGDKAQSDNTQTDNTQSAAGDGSSARARGAKD